MASKMCDEFEIFCPPPENIQKMADGSGLCYKTIKKILRQGEKLPLFNNSFEDLKTTTEKKFGKDICREQLNLLLDDGFLEEVLRALTSVEEIILKAVEESKGKKCEFADNWHSWFKIGMTIKFFHPDEKGLNLFKSISALSHKYKEKECEKFWEKLEPKFGNVGIIIKLISKSKNEKFKIPKDRKKFLLHI